MKKFYAFFAAALISVSAFAAKDVVPSDAVLAGYYEQGNVCVCIYVPGDMACFDVVLAGSFHATESGWITSPVSDLPLFEAVEGYDGWYVTSFEPEAEPDAEKGIQAKPIMLDVDGKFNWDYQIGAATVIRGGVQVVQGAYAGEIDLINYGTDAPNVFTVDAWKSNPCTAVYHNYKITVVSVGCDGYAVPFVVGSFTDWAFVQMQLDEPLTIEYEVPVYTHSFKAAEEAKYQIVSGTIDDEGAIVDKPAWADAAYIQENIEGEWTRINGGQDFVLGETVEITYDLRNENLRWARCDDTPAEYTVLLINLPKENAPEAIEIIGTFDDWQGTAMEKLESGWYFVELEAKASQYFKFRGAGSWDQELEVYDAENDEWRTIKDNELVFGQLWHDTSYKGTPCKSIGDNDEWDLSDPELYRWKAQEQGIENITLTEKAQKVVVDGVLYIVRDNKMFNVQGTQVR
jgi:hypothetical protein